MHNFFPKKHLIAFQGVWLPALVSIIFYIQNFQVHCNVRRTCLLQVGLVVAMGHFLPFKYNLILAVL